MESSARTPLLKDRSNDVELIQTRKTEPNQELKIIPCSSCKCELSYPNGCCCVQCPKCGGITAVQPLSCLFCLYCGTSVYYLANSASIKCKCGRIYQCNPS